MTTTRCGVDLFYMATSVPFYRTLDAIEDNVEVTFILTAEVDKQQVSVAPMKTADPLVMQPDAGQNRVRSCSTKRLSCVHKWPRSSNLLTALALCAAFFRASLEIVGGFPKAVGCRHPRCEDCCRLVSEKISKSPRTVESVTR